MEHQEHIGAEEARARLIQSALDHVAFEGWSDQLLEIAIKESNVPHGLALALMPRGGLDLALAYHRQGDEAMSKALGDHNLEEMRFRDRVALAVRLRLEIADKEALRRSMAFFALPNRAPDGTTALWNTADRIWRDLGDHSRDLNWYTKRMSLLGVLSATLLYWLGDESAGHSESWAFLDRRIDDVMQFEGTKARLRENSFFAPFMRGTDWVSSVIKAPSYVDADKVE